MSFELSELSLYVLILLSFASQTSARRAQMLTLQNNTTTTTTIIPASNNTTMPTDTNNVKPTPTQTNDIKPTPTNKIKPTSTNANDIKPTPTDTNDIKPTPTETNDTKPVSLEKTPLRSPLYFAPSPNPQEAAKTTDEFFTPNAIVFSPQATSPPTYIETDGGENDMSYDSQLKVPAPASAVTIDDNDFFTPPGTQNDVVFSPQFASPPPYVEDDDAQNNMSFYFPLKKAPALEPATTVDDDNNMSPSLDLSDSENPPVAPVVDDGGDYNIEVAPAPPLVVLPSTYEADVEVDPELVEEIKAYTESEEDHEHQSRTAVVVAGAICLVGVGGLFYKKRKNDAVKKSQYQYLNKRDNN